MGSAGTFRLEFTDPSADGEERSRVDADHDGRYWTSQLSANSSAEEVRARVSKHPDSSFVVTHRVRVARMSSLQ